MARVLLASLLLAAHWLTGCVAEVDFNGPSQNTPVGSVLPVGDDGVPALAMPVATLSFAPRYSVPADGETGITIAIALTGPDISARSVVVRARSAGPAEPDAVISDDNGAATVVMTSTVAGAFALEVEVDGVLAPVEGDAVVVFSTCRSLEETFLREAWPVVFSRCVGCHNEFGYAPASGARFVLPFPGGDDFAALGVAAVRDIVQLTALDEIDQDAADLDDERREVLLVSPDDRAVPLIFMNPIFADRHSGGVVLSPSEAREIEIFRSFVARVQKGSDTCGASNSASVADEDLLSLVEPLPPREHYKRARVTLMGQNAPAAAANNVVDADSLSAELDVLLANRLVENRLAEIWNDWLLTDAKIGDGAQYLGNPFPRRTFFEALQSEGARGVASCNDATPANCCRVPATAENAETINAACIAKRTELLQFAGREPMEIMKVIWREDLPAETIVTGDFTVVNPALARAYGQVGDNNRTFLDGTTTAFNANVADDLTETRKTKLVPSAQNAINTRAPGLGSYPHQGVMTTAAFLSRYPNTVSNRERTRARVVFETFLGVPVMKLAAFATPEIPPGQSLENLTWDTQPCVVCHTVLDPVAAVWNMFPNASSNITLNIACRHEGMRSPGFGLIALPGSGDPDEGLSRPALDNSNDCRAPDDGAGRGANDTRGRARLAWLADRVVEHPRFAYAVIVPLYEGLLGTKLISPPDSLIDPDFDAKARAFIAQQRELGQLIDVFRGSGGRLRPVVKAILLSRSFSASHYSVDVDDDTARVFELLGIGHKSKLLTPEVLAVRLQSLVGMAWNRGRNPNQPSQLGRNGTFAVFFGGIDSENVTIRSRDPVAIRAAVARRMANEVACLLVPQEFAVVTAAERRLFRDVEIGELPVRVDGTPDDAAAARVRAQIRRLHNVLWQEESIDEEEIEASFALYLATIDEMRAPADGGTTPNNIGSQCHATSKFVDTADNVRPPFPATGTVVIDGVEHRRVTADPTFTVRAWMAVTSAILADARFLFE